MKLEVVVLPVADADRAKDFYTALGWREDADVGTGEDFRVVQLTPPGSACSVIFGTGLTEADRRTVLRLQQRPGLPVRLRRRPRPRHHRPHRRPRLGRLHRRRPRRHHHQVRRCESGCVMGMCRRGR
ncbi:VOC family protein [Actinomadura sp. GTD37]|uniref:VOC family protein n=1 Tax=Actinomadura sp. GTD37 TaxID=1778030 RepID=UPI0035BFE39A